MNLREEDYDALFAAMKRDMPKVWREIFPELLEQLEATGALIITVTDTQISVRVTFTEAPRLYEIKRRPRLHWRLPRGDRARPVQAG
jgi:hypothetical protein